MFRNIVYNRHSLKNGRENREENCYKEIDAFWILPRDARSASVVLLSYVVRPSVRLSVRLSVTLLYCGYIRWTSSKLIARIISLGALHLGATTSAI